MYMYKTLRTKAAHSIHKNLHTGRKKLVKLLLTILYYLRNRYGYCEGNQHFDMDMSYMRVLHPKVLHHALHPKVAHSVS
jgi:hypothetical protein